MTLGGFEQAGRLLEFDQVLAQVASYCRTVLGREKGGGAGAFGGPAGGGDATAGDHRDPAVC